MTCQNCIFFKNPNTIGMGICCRFPPIPIASVSSSGSGTVVKTEIKTVYPEVYMSFWCGECISKD